MDLLKNWVEHAQLLGISVSASGLRQYELRGNRAIDNVKVGLHQKRDPCRCSWPWRF